MKALAWAMSDIGRKRDHNEDSHLSDEKLGLFAVADGMGGHQGGDRASRLAVEVLRREIAAALAEHGDFEAAAREVLRSDPLQPLWAREPTSPTPLVVGLEPRPAAPPAGLVRWGEGTVKFDEDEPYDELGDMPTDPSLALVPPAAATILRAAARAAGRTIFDAAQSDANLQGMGTTLTALLLHKDRAHLVHVGDSRAFLIREGVAVQLTEDHSWIAEQVRAGLITEDEARESKFRHIITRSVGFEREVTVDLLGVPLVPGDCFILCSDGMSNHVTPDEIARVVATTWYGKVPTLLVDLANDRGGDDNITVVLVYAANEE
jgi:serine/threonine protein phosphatase PrpC